MSDPGEQVTLTTDAQREAVLRSVWGCTCCGDDTDRAEVLAAVEQVVAEQVALAKAEAWHAALEHVWKLADPASTVDLGINQERWIITGIDVVQAQKENPFKGPR